ncbi:MAG: hypothetical protein RI562_06930 [Salibacter sp.]|uniref:hypothetical protein n=1 Tax=Salibacter sp. TaxID=2010995 RepID=UPI0028700E06|nr:hypothetical protein [Salibacter sp.]MDR9398779.1 hypothetical protein [Salibacter sp.]
MNQRDETSETLLERSSATDAFGQYCKLDLVAVWWFGGLVVWWFGGLVVWWLKNKLPNSPTPNLIST